MATHAKSPASTASQAVPQGIGGTSASFRAPAVATVPAMGFAARAKRGPAGVRAPRAFTTARAALSVLGVRRTPVRATGPAAPSPVHARATLGGPRLCAARSATVGSSSERGLIVPESLDLNVLRVDARPI